MVEGVWIQDGNVTRRYRSLPAVPTTIANYSAKRHSDFDSQNVFRNPGLYPGAYQSLTMPEDTKAYLLGFPLGNPNDPICKEECGWNPICYIQKTFAGCNPPSDSDGSTSFPFPPSDESEPVPGEAEREPLIGYPGLGYISGEPEEIATHLQKECSEQCGPLLDPRSWGCYAHKLYYNCGGSTGLCNIIPVPGCENWLLIIGSLLVLALALYLFFKK